MIIYPAIDLRGGKVVRLKEGDPQRETVFSDDPVSVARDWMEQGAKWVHMVNLDGAFNKEADYGEILERVAELNIKIQYGGGLRTINDVRRALDQGADRVVIGTAAIEEPAFAFDAVERFGADAICVALDAREGKIATHGWQKVTDLTPIEFGRELKSRGVVHALYTDVHRDGNLSGVNVHDTIALGRETGLKVIASGGVSAMTEIHQLARSQVVAGVVIGMALYEERLSLAEALLAAREI